MLATKQVVACAQSAEGLAHPALTMQTQITQERIAHQYAEPTPAQLNALRDFWSEALSRSLTGNEVHTILKFSPAARIELATSDLDDTQTNEMMLDALSMFVLGCPWPCYGDDVDAGAFSQLLRNMFSLLKFV